MTMKTEGNYGVRHLYKGTLTNNFCECGEAQDATVHYG